MKRYMKKLCMGICLLVLATGMTAFAAEDTILSGVKIGGIDVSGIDPYGSCTGTGRV